MEYRIAPLLEQDPDAIQFYWQTLAMHDKLQDRLMHLKEPAWVDVIELISGYGAQMYHVLDDTGLIVGDFMLGGAIGKAAQLHFSVHPEKKLREKIEIIKQATVQILRNPMISSLVGLTPFKHAAKILTMAGWENRGMLKGAVPVYDKQFMDAYVMITQ